MKYEVKMIRRQSANNGRNFCKYAVIIDTESQKIVNDENLRYDIADHLALANNRCKEMNEIGDYEEWKKIREQKAHEAFLKWKQGK